MSRKHVIRDIEPYSCSFVGCNSSKTRYGSRTDWLNHEFLCHRDSVEWIDIKGRDEASNVEDTLPSHLREQHSVRALELQDVSDKSQQRKLPPPSQKTTCPLCKESFSETRMSLQRHIGHHLEEIALTALPSEIYPSEEIDSDENDTNGTNSGRDEATRSTNTGKDQKIQILIGKPDVEPQCSSKKKLPLPGTATASERDRGSNQSMTNSLLYSNNSSHITSPYG